MMNQEKLVELQCEGQAYIAKAKEIAERQDGDPSSWPEPVLKEYNTNVDAAGKVMDQIRTAKTIWLSSRRRARSARRSAACRAARSGPRRRPARTGG